ncbi:MULTISPECIES: hypothetical protein [unclassified Aeromicrobium]|uniref:hypothetical protein n=1 Tax=unclassified Aeromicrobium TaxID=2633570 RepID=UPI00396AFB3D
MTSPEDIRQALAVEFNIPAEHQDLLSATDPDALRAQAEKVAALVANITPEFQANPGQGQNGGSASAEDAEYARYYPTES